MTSSRSGSRAAVRALGVAFSLVALGVVFLLANPGEVQSASMRVTSLSPNTCLAPIGQTTLEQTCLDASHDGHLGLRRLAVNDCVEVRYRGTVLLGPAVEQVTPQRCR